MAPSVDTVVALFEEGVEAFAETSDAVTDWHQPVCGTWSALETVRHVAAVIDWYHTWLDRAEAGDRRPPFSHTGIDARNDEAINARADLSVADAIRHFRDASARYVARVRPQWDLPFAYPYGRSTAGLHLGMAASEWHLHTWDLSHATPALHVPEDPGGLFRAAAAGTAAIHSGGRRLVVTATAPIAARLRPWESLLRASGRRL